MNGDIRKMKIENKFQKLWEERPALIGFCILLFYIIFYIIIIILLYNHTKNCESCTQTVNNICIDTSSQFCGCDMAKHQCMLKEGGLCNLAKCLNTKNVTLYYLESCPHCIAQLAALHPFENSINKIECSSGNCNIGAYPTWFNGTHALEGIVNPEQLFEIWGCSLG